MKIRTVLFTFIMLILGVFALLNLAVFSAPTRLNLVFGEVQAPLGLLMLTAIGLISVAYLVFLARTEAVALRQLHQSSRELEKARKLADEAESSRFTELQEYLADEFESLRKELGASTKTRNASGKWEESKVG